MWIHAERWKEFLYFHVIRKHFAESTGRKCCESINYDKDKNRFILALRKNRFGTFTGMLETCFNAGLFGTPFVEYVPVEKKSKDDYG